MGLVAGLGSVMYISLLWLLVLYLYGVVGVTLFSKNDPFHFGHLPMAVLTLFRCTTLEDWTDVMYINYYGCDVYDSGIYTSANKVSRIKGWAGSIFNGFDCVNPSTSPTMQWLVVLYFISFVFITTFTILSLFIGAVVMGMMDAMNKADEQDKKTQQPGEAVNALQVIH
jgi:voltage-gated sodium channel